MGDVMIESDQLGWRAQPVALEGKQAELRPPAIDDPQFESLLLCLHASGDAWILWGAVRSILNAVMSNEFTPEQIALLDRLHPHLAAALQRLSTAQGAAPQGDARGDFTKALARASLQEPYNRLTRAERELVELVWEGSSNKEIATRLDKSVRTVKSQLTSVYKKFGVKGRSKLVALLR